MRIEPLTCALGAELLDVNLGDAVRDDDLFNTIYDALLRYKVLFLRDQNLDKLSRRDHMAFAMRLGQLEDHPMAPSHPDAPGLVQIYKTPDNPPDRYENAWHVDGTWRETPALGCVLRCIECPPVGGDTMWANMALAYEKLPDDVKRDIEGLIASHSFNASFAAAMPHEQRLMMKDKYPDAEHPVVRTHPETGEKILFVNAFTSHFVNYHKNGRVRYGQDYNKNASDLLQYLISQAYIPEYQVRWRWKPYSMAIWDNRSTQHYAVMDYSPCHRKMERAAIVGDKPF
ncbi:TauD/TfdA family dioxygenase [Crenobacter sp. SG2305]|uniref:TauD/TfdA dioxygenase family protein n=1 Tax=Crenobacter oryzisoli TaxID=3056844 RepID=UPI0025AA9106|nr:TauD/TfdA family dioxygenase [Crenobacter sp. SG2305]MDN0085487.1 TauD/TfdA family dioxygenase [Crenobacter sp. SG2305]